jgi:hypothetical protein
VLEVLQRAAQIQASHRANEREDLARRLAHAIGRMFR